MSKRQAQMEIHFALKHLRYKELIENDRRLKFITYF